MMNQGGSTLRAGQDRNRRACKSSGISPGPFRTRELQRGAILPLFAIGVIALIAMAGLALDMGHAYLNRTRLQNAVDAAALSGAKTLDETNDTSLATAAARSAFSMNAAASGNSELSNIAGDAVIVEFSETLSPFAPGGASPNFVRVGVANFSRPAWLIQVIGVHTVDVSARAVAGPSPVLPCPTNVVPLLACGDPTKNTPPTMVFGYPVDPDAPVVSPLIKDSSKTQVTPGNFQLLELGCSGAACLRDNLAGGYQSPLCVGDTTNVDTKTGNTVGPVHDGIAARIASDVITTTPLSYAAYKTTLSQQGTWDNPAGIQNPHPRIMTVPFVDCTGLDSGKNKNVPILGYGCFFLNDQPTHKGNTQTINSELLYECINQSGGMGTSTGLGPGPHTIILYKDFGAADS